MVVESVVVAELARDQGDQGGQELRSESMAVTEVSMRNMRSGWMRSVGIDAAPLSGRISIGRMKGESKEPSMEDLTSALKSLQRANLREVISRNAEGCSSDQPLNLMPCCAPWTKKKRKLALPDRAP